MAITYTDVIPTLIENTTMRILVSNGVERTYNITPVSGYVIHDKSLDETIYDDITSEPTGEINLGYTRGMISVSRSYDFTANPREIYAVPESEVDENYIYGGIDNEHEVM